MRRIFILMAALISSILGLTGCTIERSPTYKLAIQVQGQGTVLPKPGTSYYEDTTVVDLQAIPAEGWLFYGWQGEVTDPHSPEATVLVDRAKTVTAIFIQPLESLVMEAPGGLITQRADGSQVSPRPAGLADIQYIMIHAISDAAANPTNPFQMHRIRSIFDTYGVEAHYVIDRMGMVYRLVEDHLVARHAGAGSWAGDPRLTNNMNRYAIGIELLGVGTSKEMQGVIGVQADSKLRSKHRGYTAEQYQALQGLLYHLRQSYGISPENIISHKQYDPDRKWDPGVLFEWKRIGLN